MAGSDDEEVTTVHAGELGSTPRAESPFAAGPGGSPRPEGTVRLFGASRPAAPREETVVLAPNDVAPEPATLRASDSGWGTVVMPSGGHPAQVADRTQLLDVDDPTAVTTTTRLSPGAPEPVDAVDTSTLTAIGRPPRIEPASTSPFRRGGVQAWAPPRIGLASPPTGPAAPAPREDPARARRTAPSPIVPAEPPREHVMAAASAPPTADSTIPIARQSPAAPTAPVPAAAPVPPPSGDPPVVPISGAHPVVISGGHPVVISGGHPVVPLTPTGGHPIVPRAAPRARGRGSAPTGAHAGVRPAARDDTRLAWGILLGVLITVAIVSGAVALALYLLG